jgi:hypothetical protein
MDTNTEDSGASTAQSVPEAFWAPETHNYVPRSASELEQKLKLAGIKLRRELLMNSKNEFDAWATLMTPPSIHESSHTLVQMLAHLPNMDKDHFVPLGDNSVSTNDEKVPPPHHQTRGVLP